MLIGIIGAGTMGTNHARVLSAMKDVDICISEVNEERCRDIAGTFNAKSHYFDHNEMLEKENLDGVIIAAPSQFHKKLFLDCIRHKVNILVEKPIAENLHDANMMIEKARENGVIFTIGHVERFNPVISRMKEMVKELGEIYLVNTVRAGPFPKRLYGSPGGVLVDLAVHDADIISYLVGDIDEVFAHVIRTGSQEIYANVLFKIGNIRGSSEFSWVSPKRVRTIEIYGTNGMLRGDYHSQNLWFYENQDSAPNDAGHSRKTKNLFEDIILKGNVTEGRVIQHPIRAEEPLKLELQNFVDSISGQKPLVKPEEARKALAVALSILESGNENKAVKVIQ